MRQTRYLDHKRATLLTIALPCSTRHLTPPSQRHYLDPGRTETSSHTRIETYSRRSGRGHGGCLIGYNESKEWNRGSGIPVSCISLSPWLTHARSHWASLSRSKSLEPTVLHQPRCQSITAHKSKSITPHKRLSMRSARQQPTQHKTHFAPVTQAMGPVHEFTNTLQPVCSLQ